MLRCISLSHARPTPLTSTLSLHDALPIYDAALTGEVDLGGFRCAGRLQFEIGPRFFPEHLRREHLREAADIRVVRRSEEHTSELQSHSDLVCRLLLEKKKHTQIEHITSNH